MKFMMLVKGGCEGGGALSPELEAAIGKLAEEMFRTGKMVDMGGLLPAATGARIRIGGGKMTVTDGPFAESKELIGGYAIMRTESREEAIELGRRFMKLHTDILGPSYESELEIRQMFEEPESQQEQGRASA
jgi:hypothetical protein